jgi:Type II secretion system (T2SS), protein G
MKPKTKKILVWSTGVVVAFLFVGSLVPVTNRSSKMARVAITRVLIQDFDAACRTYKADSGNYPSGSLSEMVSALEGKNPHGVIYLQFLGRYLNQAGEPIDPWKTPFRFVRPSDTEPPQLISAGPDRVFGTKDDVMLDKR